MSSSNTVNNPPDATSPSNPSHSRSSSTRSLNPNPNPNPHAPLTPSNLREAHTLSVSPNDRGSIMDDAHNTPLDGNDSEDSPLISEQTESPILSLNGKDHDSLSAGPQSRDPSKPAPKNWPGRNPDRGGEAARETTSLLQRRFEIDTAHVHEGPCDHGTFSPNLLGDGASIKTQDTADSTRERGFFGSLAAGITGSNDGRRSATARLAEEHGLTLSKTMYVSPLASESFLSTRDCVRGSMEQLG